MDTFKGQDNKCDVLILLYNLTNKFQLLDFSVNKAVKRLIQDQYNDLFAYQVFTQVQNEKDTTDVKISFEIDTCEMDCSLI